VNDWRIIIIIIIITAVQDTEGAPLRPQGRTDSTFNKTLNKIGAGVWRVDGGGAFITVAQSPPEATNTQREHY
jgi:hypothetical protein